MNTAYNTGYSDALAGRAATLPASAAYMRGYRDAQTHRARHPGDWD